MAGGPKVIVGDDSALARSVIIRSIASLGLQISEANTGNGVIRAINDWKPDLVILDISMPFPDGLAVLRKIRSDPEFKELKVIICSVEGSNYEKQIANELGVADYITKPFRISQMRDAVKSALAL